MAKSRKIPARTTVQSGRYLDYAASASPNPSSIHELGLAARKQLENARRNVADILSARTPEIIFTSGGTESNNLAIQGAVLLYPYPASPYSRGRRKEGVPHIITTNIEHPSVLETFKMLAKRQLAQITIVPVEANGIVDPKKIKKKIKKNTALVSVMYANNEIGTIQPIREIAGEIRHFNKKNSGKILFHTDAVQAVNYLDLNVEKLGVDMLTLSGTKIEGAGLPAGEAGRVGMLYKRKSASIASVFGGGDQEHGLRPGTENLPEILKFSTALISAQKIKDKETKRLTKLRDYFIASLIPARGRQARLSALGGNKRIVLNGDAKNRLPNNINITFQNIPSDLLVIELSARGIMASSKSACKSSKAEGSYVIKAVHPEIDSEIGGVRFSLGRHTTKQDIDYTVRALSAILTKLKKWYN